MEVILTGHMLCDGMIGETGNIIGGLVANSVIGRIPNLETYKYIYLEILMNSFFKVNSLVVVSKEHLFFKIF